MKKLHKEIIWIIILLLISYSIWNPQIILDLDSVDSTIDINIHDAYFVIASTNILILIIGVVFYFIYFLRIIFNKFKSNLINCIFLFANLLMIIIMSFCTQVIKMMVILPGTTIYPPLSSKPVVHQGNGLDILYSRFIIILVIFIVTFILVTAITLINYKRKDNHK
ncbi:hypothetical protein C4F50_01620 [Flavobacterium sp. KB82]|uniref:Uncharacterized protein n=2 Tax=Flavobacterium hungaricum TaxID=2082725 RepID=A0ABR9TED3_9FLAO|nr:hypothetical protein [Flavobacterium hungaricum]